MQEALNFLHQHAIFTRIGVPADGLDLPVKPTPLDLQRALGLEEGLQECNRQQFFTIMVKAEDLPSNLTEQQKTAALSTFFIVSPFMLYTLHQFMTMVDPDMQSLHADETHKFVRSKQLFYVWGTNLIDSSHIENAAPITHQFRPFLYQPTWTKTSLCSKLAIKTLKRLSRLLFQRNFSPKFVVFDTPTFFGALCLPSQMPS